MCTIATTADDYGAHKTFSLRNPFASVSRSSVRYWGEGVTLLATLTIRRRHGIRYFALAFVDHDWQAERTVATCEK